MKNDLEGDIEKDQGSLGGLRDVFTHVGRDLSKGPRNPPGWRSVDMALVASVF